MNIIQKYKLEITLFCSGAIVMIFEILGSRIYGPFLGTSTFVWTSLIGVILGFLSLGYYVGGIRADKEASVENVSLIFYIAAIAMFFVFLTNDWILRSFQGSEIGLELSTFLSAIIIFGPVSFFLGLDSPFVVKLKIKNLETSGEIVGRMYALGTLGSITGTFAAGFFLIPLFGTNILLLGLILALLSLSIFVSPKPYFILKIVSLILLIGCMLFTIQLRITNAENGHIDIDTKYSRIQMYDYAHSTGKQARVMQINTENHSSMFLGSDELTNEYTNYYHLAQAFYPDFQHSLMLGGAGYSFPKDHLRKYPEKTLDVIEIDEGVTELARKYFGLKSDERMNIFHQDAREYLNTTNTKYDVIFGDAFTSYYSVPYQLTTKEAIQKKYDILNKNGLVILNIISSIEGEKGKFLRAEYATYKTIFPQVYVIPVDSNYQGKELRNLMLIASKSDLPLDFSSQNGELQRYLDNVWKKEIESDMPILTDNYAPVNAYIADIF